MVIWMENVFKRVFDSAVFMFKKILPWKDFWMANNWLAPVLKELKEEKR